MNQLTALAELLSERIQTALKAGNSILLELGRMQNDFSLTADSLKDSIPKGDYLLSLSLTESPRNIKPGDRVLVAWVGGQPIVTNIIMGGKDVDLVGGE